MKKKYLESFQMNISNSYCKNVNITCIFKMRNLFNSLINSSLFSTVYSNVNKKTGIQMFV